MTRRDVSIPTPDGSCDASLHAPDGAGPWPAVIMFPDAGGVRPTFHDMAQQLADLGYVVLLPNVYYRIGDFEPFDMQTVFSVVPCPPGDAINFSFDYGFVLSNSIVFHVDPGPPPYQTYWNYTVSNSTDSLRIDGTLGTAQQNCVDVPTQFSHSNVVAVLLPGPRLGITEFSSRDGALLFIQGHAHWTNVIEASTDLVTWTPISTNLMPNTLCPICPYILYRDAASTNLARRFYRCFEIP